MTPQTSKTRQWGLVAALVAGATSFVLAAQAPAPPAAPAPSPQQGPAAGPPGPNPARAGGPGRGGRGGPETLAGGPQLDDPAYEGYDFAKRDPLLPLTPEEEAQKFILQPGYRMELVLADPIIEEPSAI